MSGGGQPKPTTTTTTHQLSPEQQEIVNLAMPGVRDFAASVPQRYQGQTVAGFDPSQTAGQNMALGAAGTQNNIGATAANAHNQVLTNLWDPSAAPVQNAVAAATRPIMQTLTEDALPAIRGGYTGDNFGSSRQGIAEGLAMGKASQAVGDTSARLIGDLYKTNVDASLKALGLTPSIQSAQTAGAVTTSGVGDVRQSMAQNLLNQNVAGYNYDQMAPFLQAQELMSLVAGIPGGTTTSVGTGPSTNPVSQGLGGAAAGASLGSAIMPGVGTGVGAGIGALLPFLLA